MVVKHLLNMANITNEIVTKHLMNFLNVIIISLSRWPSGNSQAISFVSSTMSKGSLTIRHVGLFNVLAPYVFFHFFMLVSFPGRVS
jgi:hypothetical protein